LIFKIDEVALQRKKNNITKAAMNGINFLFNLSGIVRGLMNFFEKHK